MAHSAPVTAKKSDDFVNSIGINIKLDRNVYNNSWSQVKSRFQELGVWHYRDGLQLVNNSSTYRSRFQSLYNESGAIGLFVWGPWENQGKPGPDAVGAAKKGLDYVKIISGPNEPDLFWENNYDNNSSTDLWDEVRNYQNSMYNALKADSATDDIVITTPPLSTYTKADDLGNAGSINTDRIAWHFYTGQGHPDKNELGTGINNTRNGLNMSSAPTSDFYTTEAGHNSWKTANPGNTNGSAVSELTQMRYNIRIVAEHFRRGVRRTYLHQLMDLGTNPSNFNNSWGIVRADSSKTPKPAFTALKNMINLFKERSWNSSSKTWSNPSFSPGTLDYSITGSTSGVKNVLLQKSNGDFYMLVWVAEDSWNESNDTDRTVSRNITVAFANSQTVTRQTFNNSGGLISGSITSSNGNKNWAFTASTTMSILKITAGSGGGGGFSGFYNIRTQHNGPNGRLYLRGYNGVSTVNMGGINALATMFNQPTWSTQKWEIIDIGGGYYNLRCEYNGPDGRLYLRGYNGNSVNPNKDALNALATMYNEPTFNTQKWQLIDIGGGYYNLRCKHSGPDGRLYLRGYNANSSSNKDGLNSIATMFNQPTYGTQKWQLISAP